MGHLAKGTAGFVRHPSAAARYGVAVVSVVVFVATKLLLAQTPIPPSPFRSGASSERHSGLREASFRGGALRRRRRVGRCVRGDQVAAGPDPYPPVSVPIWGI